MHKQLLEHTRTLGTLIELAIIACILYRRTLRDWPSIFTYCILAVAGALVMMVSKQPKLLFYTYWGWIFLASILRLWVMADVVRSFAGVQMWRARAQALIFGVAAAVAASAWILTARDGTSYGKLWIARTLLADRCVSVAWAFFLIAVLLSIWLARISWNRTGALVSSSMLIKAAGAVVSSIALSLWPGLGVQISTYTLVCFSLCSLSIWLWAFSTAQRRPGTNDIRFRRVVRKVG